MVRDVNRPVPQNLEFSWARHDTDCGLFLDPASSSKVREARVWLADTRERRQALLDRKEGRELDPTDTCELYDMDKTLRRLTEFIDGDSAYLAIARAVVSDLGS